MTTDSPTRRSRPPGSTPEIIVLSREDAENYVPRGQEVCISIADPMTR